MLLPEEILEKVFLFFKKNFVIKSKNKEENIIVLENRERKEVSFSFKKNKKQLKIKIEGEEYVIEKKGDKFSFSDNWKTIERKKEKYTSFVEVVVIIVTEFDISIYKKK